MNKTIQYLGLFLLVTLASLPAVASSSRSGTVDLSLEIEHWYFNHRFGVWWTRSEDYPGGHWNELDLSLQFLLRVQGPEGYYDSELGLRAEVFRGSRKVLERNFNIGVLSSENGAYTVPILLNGPFCEELTVRATVTRKKLVSSEELKLDFRCGE